MENNGGFCVGGKPTGYKGCGWSLQKLKREEPVLGWGRDKCSRQGTACVRGPEM